MAGNTVYVQGSYVDVHDNEVVNLSIDKATVSGVNLNDNFDDNKAEEGQRSEELFHFIHPELDDESTNSERRDTLPLENRVLKKNHNGKCIDFQALHKMLRESFVDEIKYNYEWLAPWRILDDLSLLEDTTLTAFAEQMNKWYPDAKKPCNADSMGDYFNPYLGSTAFVLWDENEFKKRKTNKQSINGYRLLYNDCETIKEALKSFFKSREYGRDKE